ncbi:MAG: hypothetical protein ABFD51_12145 [Anaerolineaceae bacterium]
MRDKIAHRIKVHVGDSFTNLQFDKELSTNPKAIARHIDMKKIDLRPSTELGG